MHPQTTKNQTIKHGKNIKKGFIRELPEAEDWRKKLKHTLSKVKAFKNPAPADKNNLMFFNEDLPLLAKKIQKPIDNSMIGDLLEVN